MFIKHVEIGNFRKLEAVRIDFSETTTIFVGANNSGKTSAITALRRFLIDRSNFSINDITLTHWAKLDQDAAKWEALPAGTSPDSLNWNDYLPFLDVWLDVPLEELHHVQALLPTLDWSGTILGVRLRYEPGDPVSFQQSYLAARNAVREVMQQHATSTPLSDAPAATPPDSTDFSLSPRSMMDFLSKSLNEMFVVNAYLLDGDMLVAPKNGIAQPQQLRPDSVAIGGDPFSKIIHFEDIGAQRGLDNSSALEADEEEPQGRRGIRRHATKLSRQLRKYFNQHLDPLVAPAAEDLQALQAIHSARVEFGRKLENSFSKALQELQDLGYPGITDPKLSIAAEINAMDTLNHPSAVQYAVPTHGSLQTYQLPEGSNGLGYQNLLSIVFALMSSRDRWMRVGKAAVKHTVVNTIIPPLHLVLVEEPEAHLHAPVQQVFIKRAYDVLRNHDDLRKSTALRTQLVVSTHSSHIAHQADFASLRYFRRLPLNTVPGSVPTSSVVNLSDIFGDTNETTRFVKRYIKVTHCDLFFADGAILVEGAAERIILPHLVSARPAYERLDRCYVTWLEIGGSHAHRLRSLLEHLGLDTLVITDLDAMDASTKKASPKRNAGLKTRNKTLATWIPKETSLDALLDTDRAALEATNTNGASVRVCYQQPVKIEFKGKMAEALANTFEDALLYENIAMFQGLSGPGIVARFRNALNSSADLEALGESLRSALSDGSKAEFALDILLADETFITSIAVPKYIHEGLVWLAERLTRRDEALALSAGLPQ